MSNEIDLGFLNTAENNLDMLRRSIQSLATETALHVGHKISISKHANAQTWESYNIGCDDCRALIAEVVVDKEGANDDGEE